MSLFFNEPNLNVSVTLFSQQIGTTEAERTHAHQQKKKTKQKNITNFAEMHFCRIDHLADTVYTFYFRPLFFFSCSIWKRAHNNNNKKTVHGIFFLFLLLSVHCSNSFGDLIYFNLFICIKIMSNKNKLETKGNTTHIAQQSQWTQNAKDALCATNSWD